jgi:hypothetical protein
VPGIVCRSLSGWIVAGVLVLAVPAGAACTGDCNGNGMVTISELVRAVGIALDQATLQLCQPIDRDRSGRVEIFELIDAVNALLDGCPDESTVTPSPVLTTPTPTDAPTREPTDVRTPTATAIDDVTPTATVNQPPALPTASIYRTYPGFPIRIPVDATDPEGEAASCAVVNLPAGAAFDDESDILSWTPTDEQLGPTYLPYTCTDAAVPPAAAVGQLTFQVSPLDACTIPICAPATGCSASLAPVSLACCAGEPTVRVAEPVAGCPEGRVLYVGQNEELDSFGRLQNCDVMVLRSMPEASAEASIHIETRCVNTSGEVRLHARMDSTADNHPVLLDSEHLPFRLAEEDDGFARFRNLRFPIVGPGPFPDVQGADANLTVTLTDGDGTSVTQRMRLRLTFTPRPTDLPDVDPTLPPSPTPTTLD